MVAKRKKSSRSRSPTSSQVGNISKSHQNIIKAIGDETRFQILLLLKKGPRTVPQIAKETNRTRYNFYHHLNYLEKIGIISSRVVGRSRKKKSEGKNQRKVYSLTPSGREQMRSVSQLIGSGRKK